MVLQTILVYVFLLIILYLLASAADKNNNFSFILLGVFIYAIIFGLRSGVGVDFWGYKEWYDELKLWGSDVSEFEIGFTGLGMLCVNLHLSSAFFFGLIAFLQLFLIFAAVKPYSGSYRMLVLTFMLGCIWLSYANGLRQQLAFCIFAYSIQFIDNKSLGKYCISVILAALCHTSAILLLIVYPLCQLKTEWFHRVVVQCILLAAALILSNLSVVTKLVEHIDDFAIYLGYGVYFESDEFEFTKEVSIGIGFFVNLMLNLFLLINSNVVKRYYNSHYVNIIYDLYFIGIILKYIFINSQLFSRLNYYFMGFEFIFASFAIYTFMKNKQTSKFLVLLGLYVLIFIATLYRMQSNTSLFLFYWQN